VEDGGVEVAGEVGVALGTAGDVDAGDVEEELV